MLTEGNSLSWHQLGPVLIRAINLYQNINLPFAKDCLYSCCPYGGPIAIARKNEKSIWIIGIFTQKGDVLCSIEAVELCDLFWTKNQELLLLHENGQIIVYSVYGKELQSFDLEINIRNHGFLKAAAFYKRNTTGFFIMDRSQTMYFVNDVISRVNWKMNLPKSVGTLSCYAIVCTELTSVILCYGEQFCMGVQGSMIQHINYSWMFSDGGTYTAASTSWNNEKIAFLHSSMCVQVTTSNLEYLLYTIVTPGISNIPPTWCGNDVLVFSKSSTELIFYSMAGDEYKKTFFDDIWYSRDSDGLRIFQKNNISLMLVVPGAMVEVLGLVSDKPGAFLLLAYQHYEKKAYLTFDYLINIRKNLHHAVEQCLNAAAHHFDTNMQKQLLYAVQFGKAMLYNYNPEKFVDITSTLRCLNAVRTIGIPVSFTEYNEIGLLQLINRLINLHHWPLALQICNMKNVPNSEGADKIISHWIDFIFDQYSHPGKSINTELLTSRIFEHVNKLSVQNYADIAAVVYKKDMKRFADVANTILKKETDVNKRVDMYLEFGSTKAALDIARESHLPQLICKVISHMRKNENSGEVDRQVIKRNTSTGKLYKGFVREYNPNILLALYKQQDDYIRQALIHLDSVKNENNDLNSESSKEAEKSFVNENTVLKSKLESLEKAGKCFSNKGDMDLEQLIKHNVNLINQNAVNDKIKKRNLINESVRNTFIFAVGEGNDHQLAEKIKKEHRLTDKQIWRWTIDAYVKIRNKNNLNDMALKKQFTGYLSFIEAAVRNNDITFANEFIPKLSNPEEKIKGLCITGRLVDAAKVAASINDLESLKRLILLYKTSEEREEIMSLMNNVKQTLNTLK